MQDFRQLGVWQNAHQLVLDIYASTANLPSTENFGLLLLLRRNAVTVATRVADGAGRENDGDFAFELKKARAAANELEYLLLLAHDLGYLPEATHSPLAANLISVRKMLAGLIRRLSSP